MFGLLNCESEEKFSLKSLQVECHINNSLVVCLSKFTYRNSTNSNTESLFSFPLEGSCSVYHFECDIAGKKILGVCKEKEEAKNMYKAATEAGHKAAMIERHSSMTDVFKCRIGNFPRNSDAIISLTFIMELNLSLDKSKCIDTDRFCLCLPLILRPRYTPEGYDGDVDVFNVNNKYHYEFVATITGTKEIRDVFSNNHQLKLIFNNDSKTSAKVILESTYDGTHDLDVNIDYVKMKVPSVLYEYGTTSDQFKGTKLNGAFYKNDVAMLNFLPQFINKKTSNKIEIVFIVDRSGSMGGSNIERAKECLLIFLKSLPTQCKFQIYGFGSTFDKAFPDPQLYDETSIEVALNYQRHIDADFGGTELMLPLSDLYRSSLASDYKRVAFLLTDGDVGNQDEVSKLVRVNNHSTRLFTVGIGDGVSTSLVQKVAESGLGKSVFVRDSKTLSASVIELLDVALNCDQFTDVAINWQCPRDVTVIMVPNIIRPIYSNYFLTVLCMIKGLRMNESVKCILTGKVSGEMIDLRLEVNGTNGISDNDFRVHRLLAKYQIDEIMQDIEGGRDDLKKSLIELSLEANMVTDYTTFVAIDPDLPETGLIVNEEPEYEMDMCNVRLYGGGGGAYDQVDCMYGGGGGAYDQVDCMDCCYEEDSGLSIDGYKDRDVENLYLCTDEAIERKSLGNFRSNDQDIVMYLAEKQNIHGYWKSDENIIIRIGLDQQKVNAKYNVSINANVWITVLIYSYLVIKLSSREKEWRLFAKKAKEWIENNVHDDSMYSHLMELGRQLINEII